MLVHRFIIHTLRGSFYRSVENYCMILHCKIIIFHIVYCLLPTASLPSTPHYNSLVLRDLIMSRTNSEVAQVIKEYPNLRDGIILLKIWLRQRELNKGYDGFTGYIITMFVIYLLRKKKLNTFMSSYQIVRNVWICLGILESCHLNYVIFLAEIVIVFI